VKFLFIILYDFGILLYRIGIQIASIWNLKAKQWIDGRKNWSDQIVSQLKPNEFRIWFHCASVGEFEQGRPVIEAYRKKFPAHKIVLTFYSPSGYELRKRYSAADYIFYLPLDTKRNAKQFISLVNPSLAVFVKYELWFHFLSEISQKNIPAIMISAIFRENHLLFNFFFQPLREAVKSFRKIFVQDQTSLQLLQQNQFTNAELAGDTRFDRVWQIAQSPKQLSMIEQFKADKKLLVAGSTWPDDEKLLLQLIRDAGDEWKWIIVPHEIDASHIISLKLQIQKGWIEIPPAN
jgi:3-deoxy-D-manno-octulosonic-acid transferase